MCIDFRKSCFLLLLFCLCLAPLRLQAQENNFSVDPQEQEAFKAYQEFKDIKARQLLREVMKRDRASPVANFVLAMSLQENEGDASQALRYMDKAIAELLKRCGTPSDSPTCMEWYTRMILERVDTLKNLDRYQEAYDQLIKFENTFLLDASEAKIWLLVKLGRVKEADAIATERLQSDDPEVRKIMMHYRCIIVAELNHRQEADEVCSEAARLNQTMVSNSNAHIAKMSVFDLEGAERMARTAVNLPDTFMGSIWEVLVYQYVLEGRFAEAVSAAEQAAKTQRESSGIEAHSSRANFLSTIGSMLLILGKMEGAYRMIHESYELPDRAGSTSVSLAFNELMNNATYYAASKSYEEYLSEISPYLPFKERGSNFATRLKLKFNRNMLVHRTQKLMQKKDYLSRLLTPYPSYMNPASVQLGLEGVFVDIAGRGPFHEAWVESRNKETELKDKSEPYYQLLAAQESFAAGDWKESLRLAEKAQAGLDVKEVLNKTLLQTIIAYSQKELGQDAEMRASLLQVFQVTPFFIRLWGLKLPVQYKVGNTPLAEEAYDLLQKSPRLASDSQGLPLHINEQAGKIEICLRDELGTSIFCNNEIPEDKKSKDIPGLKTDVKKFVEGLFSAKVDLSQLDVNSLNGSPTKTLLKDEDAVFSPKP